MPTVSKKSKEVRTYDSEFLVYFIVFLAIVCIICFLPYLLTEKSWAPLNVSKPNEIGDALGGTLGPFVALLASALTFLAFWVQYKANQQQKRDLQIERFESKFYELLRLHRANLDELNISDRVYGRKCFVRLFYEFKYCFMIATEQMKVASKEQIDLYAKESIDLMKFSYTIFFYGVGVNSEKQFLTTFNESEKSLYADCKKIMTELQYGYMERKSETPSLKYYEFDLPMSFIRDERTKVFYYRPFNGHSDLLGHYYRHLYQSVKYIVEQDNTLLDFDAKYSYVKTLRAQLSNHEQLMIYYNSVAWFDEDWKKYFTDYRLIKNIPLGLADFGIKPEEKYKDDIIRLKVVGIDMFEQHS